MLRCSLRPCGRVFRGKGRIYSRPSSSYSHIHPTIRGYVQKLELPKFGVDPNNIRILAKPIEFHSLLVDMISRAKSRIFISSLYLGSTEFDIVMALAQALQRNPHLEVQMLFDLNRSTRPEPQSTAKLLLPLVEQFPDRVHVSFFRSPSLRGILARLVPPRFNEGWGTWHAKIYGVDDEVMFSGANLNKSYFTDRQDRYLHFSSQPILSKFCLDFIKTVSSFSFKLQTASSSVIGEHSRKTPDYSLIWPESSIHPHQIHDMAEEGLSSLQQTYIQHTAKDDVSDKVVLFPLMQAGQFNIRDEENALAALFNHLESHTPASRPILDLTSGYFGLYKKYRQLILDSSLVDCRIVAAAPLANGFYGSKGVSGRIPEGYTLLEQRFMAAVARAGKQPSVQLNEWHQDGWTYHAKGIWLSEPNEPPMLTLFGSTNLNSRSAHIDSELSFLMLPPAGAEELRNRMGDEIQGLRAHAVPWQGADRNVRIGTKMLVGMVGNML
ncbi:unnamed protein product [Mycena citricolor]|uniref:CDP-diacylglycerol--glycerol-3-phosphate 3-phosphatidyltransferase n=1 Tax=Mycena citricolor TaxID=2018698 RepID=A0AAD2H5P1_9AGAR|nr:unnamed protein product [Mycena citricolor]